MFTSTSIVLSSARNIGRNDHDDRRLPRPDHRRYRLRGSLERRPDACVAEAWPLNFGFLGRGNSSKPRSLIDQLAGSCLVENSRGLGIDAGCHRLLSVGRRRA